MKMEELAEEHRLVRAKQRGLDEAYAEAVKKMTTRAAELRESLERQLKQLKATEAGERLGYVLAAGELERERRRLVGEMNRYIEAE